ncbi:MAG: secretin N-terminal domain-containing protein, partial [Candidatus Omnitrophota bacterium]
MGLSARKGWGWGLLMGAILVFGVATVFAQEEPTALAPLGPEAGIVETTPGNITMDFKDADINNVLRILSYKSGVNIISGKDVQGLVTIRLTDVPWEKALDVILRTYGFAYEREGNIIRVTTVENLEREELTTEVFVLNYAKASEVIESVRDILSDRGRVRYDGRTNVLIVTDIPTNIYKISQVVRRLDQRTQQVLIEAKIIETSLGDEDTLGIDWNIQVAARGGARPTTWPWNNQRLPGELKSFGGIADTTSVSEVTVGSGGATTTSTATAAFPTRQGFPYVSTDQFTFGTLAFDQFSQVLRVLQSRRNTRILSNPRITTLNNQEATILVGEVLAIPIFERNDNTGNIEITGYSEKDLGVKLSVTPHVNDEGMILVELKPEISSLLGFDEL